MKGLLVALMLVLAVPTVSVGATMYYLVQVDGGQTLAVFGNYSTLDQCLAELKKEKARGTTGLQCQPIGGSTGGSYSNDRTLPGTSPSIYGESWYLTGRPFGRIEGPYYVLRGPFTASKCNDLDLASAATQVRVRMFGQCFTREHLNSLANAGAEVLWSHYNTGSWFTIRAAWYGE